MLRTTKIVCLLATLCWSISATATEPDAKKNQAARDARLAQALSGATLVGSFTVTGQQQLKPKPDRYELTSVKHLEEDNWLFVARIQSDDHDVTLPIALPIKWAGDTPVITVDNIGFPGLGTYTARVMIYQDHYAGFWSGADHSGHIFGEVERADTKPPTAE